jgi:hypothetical protein
VSVLSLRFREQAGRLNILYKPELKASFWEKMSNVIREELAEEWMRAVKSRLDTSDPETLWDLLGIDTLICLEDAKGDTNYIAVNLSDQEHRAYKTLTQAKSPRQSKIRRFLNIQRYWVFLLPERSFPTEEDWIDILYGEIDLPIEKGDCKMIHVEVTT